MHAHGSESYWILGEGLVSVSGDGRAGRHRRDPSGGPPPAPADEAPAFRFSRIGPEGRPAQHAEHRQARRQR